MHHPANRAIYASSATSWAAFVTFSMEYIRQTQKEQSSIFISNSSHNIIAKLHCQLDRKEKEKKKKVFNFRDQRDSIIKISKSSPHSALSICDRTKQ